MKQLKQQLAKRILEPLLHAWMHRRPDAIRRTGAINLFCMNSEGDVNRFGHAIPGYLFPVVDWVISNEWSSSLSELIVCPAPAGKLRPLRGWQEEPFVLAEFCRTLLPDVKLRFTGHSLTGCNVWIPGGEPRRPALALERDPEMINRVRRHASVKLELEREQPYVLFLVRKDLDSSVHGGDGPSYALDRKNRRTIVNVNEVERVLRNHFERVRVVSTERMSPREQIETFFNANIVVGQHGSGLWNALWSFDCKAIIELGAHHDHFAIAAQLAGAAYYELQRVPSERRNTGTGYLGSLEVDLEELSALLRRHFPEPEADISRLGTV